MRIDLITLFPELFGPFLQTGVTRRAFAGFADRVGGATGAAAVEAAVAEKPLIEVNLFNPRDFATGAYRRVDDRPFGGGPGMVMMVEPLARCIEHIRTQRQDACPVVLFSPQGTHLQHAGVVRWAQSSGAILVCGRYEGIDQRFIDTCVDEQISLGDFVLSGGEVPAMAFLDAVARLQPGVLGDENSSVQDSFNPAIQGLLDCPHYTRPETWQGPQGALSVPSVLLSGHHLQIEAWRHAQRVKATAARGRSR